MPYLMAIFFILLGIFKTKLFLGVWYVIHHVPVIILQAVASFISGRATSKLKEKNAEDTAIYKFIDNLNFCDLLSLFFLSCMIVDSNSLSSIVYDDGALMLVGFLFPFFGSFFIHVIIPEREKERYARGEHIELYKHLIGQDVEIIEGAVWSKQPVYKNVMERGMPVRNRYEEKTIVSALEYYEGNVEAKLSSGWYSGRWIPAKYLRLRYRDAELKEKYGAWRNKAVRILPGTTWGISTWGPSYQDNDYPYFEEKEKATDSDVETVYTVLEVEVAKEVVMFRLRNWDYRYSWVLLDNVELCEEEQNDDATTSNTDHNDHNKLGTPC